MATASGTFTGTTNGGHVRVVITTSTGKTRSIDADGTQWATDNAERDGFGALCVLAVLAGTTSGSYTASTA